MADAADLLRFLEGETLPWYGMRRTELANRPLICARAFGEALDPDRLERLGRHEVHLDRKLKTHAQHTDPVAGPAAYRRCRLIRSAKLLPAGSSWRNRMLAGKASAAASGEKIPGCHP
jgi:hypothetical protein